MTIGQRIRETRIKAGLTQKELAEKLGISYVGISQWENDKRNPKKETIQRIADALLVHDSDLYDAGSYSAGFEDGSKAEEDQNRIIDELWKDEGYTYSDTEISLINSFSRLNEDGQHEAVKRVSELAELPRYQRAPSDTSGAPTATANNTDEESPA